MTNIGVESCASFVSSQFQPGGAPRVETETGVRHAVTISRQAGCGARIVAEKLARCLEARSSKPAVPWMVYDRNLMEKVLEEHNLPAHLARFLPEDRVSFVEDILTDLLQTYPASQTLVRHAAETILKLASVGNVILIGRGGNVITARLPNMFHVRLVAPLEMRIEHSHKSYGMSLSEARKFCVQEDLGRERYLKTYFHANVNDPLLYHLVINTGMVGFDGAAKIIADAVLNQH
ncbi:MAG TPA: cytidylate kinase-like family protein [Verrucomicrobiae bacterium]|nr:cytidylate kinase-like family protein [Verrucomicrobiae bacterium]